MRRCLRSVPWMSTVLLGAMFVSACAGDSPAGTPVQTEPVRPKLLLIGIDGVRPDVMAEVATPNLDALATDGLLVSDVRTTSPSLSGPAWSSMLTGV